MKSYIRDEIVILVEIILGIIIADLFSGLFHWFEDTYLNYNMDIPILGEIAKDNELHHYYPREITHYSFFTSIFVSGLITILIILMLYLANQQFVIDHIYFFVVGFFVGSCANEFHKYSHYRDCELTPFIRFLQKNNILSNHEHHKCHHTKPTQRYCVILQMNNYILDYFGFWRILENTIYCLTGIKAIPNNNYDEYKEIKIHIHKKTEEAEFPSIPTLEELN